MCYFVRHVSIFYWFGNTNSDAELEILKLHVLSQEVGESCRTLVIEFSPFLKFLFN